MRLIFVSDADPRDVEGSFAPAHRLARELLRRGCRTLHATPREPGRPAIERIEGVPVRRLAADPPGEGLLGRARFALKGRWAVARWLKELEERPPAVIHAHLSPAAAWLAARAAKALGVPWVCRLAGAGALATLGPASRRSGAASLLETAAAVVAPCEEALREVEALCGSGCSRLVIPTGVEALPAPLPDEPTILGLGRLERGSGFDVLVRAFAGVRRSVPRATLVLAGEGPERRRLLAMLRALPPEAREGVRFEALPGPEGAAELIGKARVMVFPSLFGGSDAVIAQALAMGRPVVASSSAWFPVHAIDGGNCLTVRPDDAAALAQAVLSLLTDPSLAVRLAQAGQGEAIRSCSWTEVAARYLELFRSLGASGKPNGARGARALT